MVTDLKIFLVLAVANVDVLVFATADVVPFLQISFVRCTVAIAVVVQFIARPSFN